MSVKKIYNINDNAWIYGINVDNSNPVKGRVIKVLDLSDAGYFDGPHYIIEIPTHIDPLLEIRTWETISQDENGPVGAMRDLGDKLDVSAKKIKQLGFSHFDKNDIDNSDYEPTPEQIHAALEKSKNDSTHYPLVINQNEYKPKQRHFYRKKKKSSPTK